MAMEKCEWIVYIFISIAITIGCCPVACADIESSVACASKDREALLSFKAGIVEDTAEILSSWTGDDCCKGWEGVECDSRNGRVIRLILQSRVQWNTTMYMRGKLSESLGDLSFLKVMIMSDLREITGSIPSSISGLSQLTQLYLENNKLDGSIPPSLGKLSKLQTLSLSGNRLNGQIPASLGEFRRLIQLNVGKNRLTGIIPTTIQNLHGLQSLDFNGNRLSGPVPDFIGSFRHMTYLDLSSNEFSGHIPASLANLSNALDISLARNNLTGNIPSSLGRLSALSTLSLSNNMLVGVIPESLSNMSRLWYLNLSKNHLSDPLPSSLANTSLLCLDLSYNNLHLGRIPEWITRKEMTNLHLAGCGVSECLSTWKPIASSLFTSIDLSNNHLTGDIIHLLKNMSSLQRVYLSNNRLSSNLSRVSLPESVSTLDLHSNQLYGSVESIFSSGISESCSFLDGCLEFINLSKNKLTGKIPRLEGERRIKWLDLSGNLVKGRIPSSISMLKNVVRLDLSGNQMQGKIPGSIGELKELRWLDLSRNELIGKIPEQILSLKHLKHMSLKNNHLCGEIPQGKPLNVFPSSTYTHNDCLCGSPLPPCRRAMP